jgi:hypothetical protein
MRVGRARITAVLLDNLIDAAKKIHEELLRDRGDHRPSA